MAGQSPVLETLAGLIAGFDEATWEALANKGLVRRARKDLESGIVIEVEESGDSLRFQVPPYQVVMPASGPAKATCNCPARGVCQHILSAGMWLQTNAASQNAQRELIPKAIPSQDQIETEMLAITIEQLQKWGGLPAFREGRQMAASGRRGASTVGVVVVEFPGQGIQVRYTPGGGLDGMIVSGTAKSRQPTAAIAAVLCLHLAHLKLDPESAPAVQVLEEAVDAPRTRAEVLASARVILEESLQVGLSHASVSLKDRLQTLAMSAQGTNLPRLSRMLRALADETDAILARQGRASEAALFLAMSRTYALAQALQQPDSNSRSDLIGTHRTRYQELNRLELIGAAAYPWQAPSGYLGLTILYWDIQNRSWASWSDARPLVQSAGFDPLKRFGMTGPWEGVSSPEESASSKIVLVNPKRNPDGRLSSSASTKAMILGPAHPSEIDFGAKLFSDWTALRAHIAQVFPLGLRETHPLDLVVVLQPHRLGRRYFDEQKQVFRWEMRDQTGASFQLAVLYSPWTKQTIKYLEDIKVPDQVDWRFVVKITSSEMGLVAEPLSLHQMNSDKGTLFHLAFADATTKKSAAATAIQNILDAFRGADEEWDETPEPEPQGPPYLNSILGKIEKELERASESGGNDMNWSLVDAMQLEVERLGLIPLAETLKTLKGTPNLAARIFTLRYMCSLYRQSLFFA